MYDSPPIARRYRRVTAGLHRARLDQGLTITALAGEVGVTPAYLSRVERGIQRPGAALLRDLAETLGKSLDAISAVERPPEDAAAEAA